MKISQLRGLINELSNTQSDLSELDQALKRFDSMELSKFCGMIKGLKNPLDNSASNKKSKPKNATVASSVADVTAKIIRLKGNPSEFEAEIEALGKKRSFTKQDLQELYSRVFSSRTKLSSNLTKSEMVARFKRQRRRDANFASA